MKNGKELRVIHDSDIQIERDDSCDCAKDILGRSLFDRA
jgi:hypothetical protein